MPNTTSHRIRPPLLAALLALLLGCGDGTPPAAPLPEGTEVGSRAPVLEGVTASGESFRLSDARGRPAVLVFHQGVGCGLCRLRLEQLQAHASAYAEMGARVIALTPDSPELSAAAAEQLGLDFTLVSTDAETLQRWGLSDPDATVPRPASYIVDEDGVVRYRHVGRNAGDLVTDAGLLTVLARLPEQADVPEAPPADGS